MLKEKVITGLSGWTMVAILVAGPIAGVASIAALGGGNAPPVAAAGLVLLFVLDLIGWRGLTVVNPNTAQGRPAVRHATRARSRRRGLRWVNPFTMRRLGVAARPQLREQQAEGQRPRSATRSRSRPSSSGGSSRRPRRCSRSTTTSTSCTCRASPRCASWPRRYPVRRARRGRAVAARLGRGGRRTGCATEIQERLAKAGVEVIEARISHLAYAPEIANAMLRRQQATAIIAARQKIVEGAVGMVEMALEHAQRQEGRPARRGAQGDDGEQPAGRALRRPRRAARRERRARCISERVTRRWPSESISRPPGSGAARSAAALGRRRSAQPQRPD